MTPNNNTLYMWLPSVPLSLGDRCFQITFIHCLYSDAIQRAVDIFVTFAFCVFRSPLS